MLNAIYVSDIAAGSAVAKGQAVKISAGKWVPGAADDDACQGIACHSADANDLLKVCVEGEVDALIGAQLTRFGELMCDANGKLVDATAVGGEISLARALEAGDASGYGFARVSVLAVKPVA